MIGKEDPVLMLAVGILAGVAVVTIIYPVVVYMYKYTCNRIKTINLTKYNRKTKDEFYRKKVPELNRSVKHLQSEIDTLSSEVTILKSKVKHLPDPIPVERPKPYEQREPVR